MWRRLKTRVKSNDRLYDVARRTIMWFRRRRHGLTHVHSTFYMCRGCVVSRDLVAGPYAFVNVGCYISPRAELGPYVMLSPYVAIAGGDHAYDKAGVPMVFSGVADVPLTVIEADVWVGCGAAILCGVRIGRGAIVGAGAVVTKDVPAYEIHAGVPARKIGERFSDPTDRAYPRRGPRQTASARSLCSALGARGKSQDTPPETTQN